MKHRRKVVCVLLHMSDSSSRGVLQGVLRFVSLHCDWRLHILEPTEHGLREIKAVLKENTADGIISSEMEDVEMLALMARSTMPLVAIGTRKQCLPGRNVNFGTVGPDENELGAAAARHLLALGRFASFGFVHFRERYGHYLSQLRAQGFAAELSRNRARCTCYSSDLPEDQSDSDDLARWLAALPKPAAVLASHDRRAVDVVNACEAVGLRIPDDIRVLGIDNDEFACQSTRPSISSIVTTSEKEGYKAAEVLYRIMRRHTPMCTRLKETIRTDGMVAVRDSTRVLPPGAALVQRAKAFIAMNARQRLTVDDVVAYLHVSKRLAYLRFREFEGRSIHRTIVEARIECIKKKLLSSRQTIKSISKECGFDNISHCKVLFKRITGMTMGEWRIRRRTGRPSSEAVRAG